MKVTINGLQIAVESIDELDELVKRYGATANPTVAAAPANGTIRTRVLSELKDWASVGAIVERTGMAEGSVRNVIGAIGNIQKRTVNGRKEYRLEQVAARAAHQEPVPA